MMKFYFQIITVALMLLFAVAATGYVFSDHSVHNTENPDRSVHHLEASEGVSRTDISNQGKTVTVEPGEVLEIRSEGADLSYDITEIRAEAGSELTIQYINTSTMPHNVVFVNTEGDIMTVGVAALQAYENEYIPEDEMDKIFGYTSLAVPGDTVEVKITVPEKPGSYPYICTYPGHFTQMQGRLISRKN
ncbi:hypothetical protein BH23BAC3_BH23BAC3_33190 [soil metagenome]